jgi:hypothetical protein
MILSKTIFNAIFPEKKYKDIAQSKEYKYINKFGEKITIHIMFGNIFLYHSDISKDWIEINEALQKYTFDEDEYKFIFKSIKKLLF